MANRRPQGGHGGRRDFQRNDRGKNFGRNNVSPWQGGGPGPAMNNLFPLGGGSKEATLALASNIISLLQPRPNPVPSLLDMPIRRDFGPNVNRFDRNMGPNRMGNQGNFRRSGNYNRPDNRNNRKPYRPNDGPRQQNKSSPKKDADSKSKSNKESTSMEDDKKNETETDAKKEDDTKKDKKDVPKTRFDDINQQFLKCHICNKSMWDGRSFENHLSGRAHAIMMQKTAESYMLAADTMRQEYKIREMKRTRKSGQMPSRDFYCAMCDMYASDGAVHRTTIGHRKLKKYLHPTCTPCKKEMPTRIELDEHRLTPEHLRQVQEKSDITNKPKPEVLVISTLGMEQSYLRDDWQRRGPPHSRHDRTRDEHSDEEQKPDEESGESKLEQSEKPSTDTENTIVDYKEGDDLSKLTKDMLPAYSTERGVGSSFLEDFKCIQCRLCKKLLDSDETAAVHLKTWRHHHLFVRMLNEVSGNKLDNGNKRKRETSTCEEESDEKRVKTDGDENGQDVSDDKHEENQTLDEDGMGDINNVDDLEDWDAVEQSVDDILNDELGTDGDGGEKGGDDDAAETQEPTDEPIQPEPVSESIMETDELPEDTKTEEGKPDEVEKTEVTEEKKPQRPVRGRGRGRGRGRK